MTNTRSLSRSRYACLECGAIAAKWVGRCESCGSWNTIVEEPTPSVTTLSVATPAQRALAITEVSAVDAQPAPTGLAEFDRVTGGGLVPGSVTLIGGEPGVGKSTLLLQLLGGGSSPTARVLYFCAEESAQQVRRRAERIGAMSEHLFLASETSLAHIVGHVDELSPTVVVVDSIQTVFDAELSSAPGSVAQVRQCAHRFVTLAKERDIAIVLVGHVTKEGALAGPRVLEHVVDTVLSFEGDRHHSLRLLRASKHRFGSTHELGLFAMTESGLEAVTDPSEMFLADRRIGVAGSVIVPTIDGHRPLLVEVQALVADSKLSNPRRSVTGVDPGRVGLILAVLDSRLGLGVLALDVYAMAVGGARVTEPGADLALGLAVVSSLLDVSVPAGVVACGEIGLGGELRSVGGIERRLGEASRMGFTHAVVPRSTPELDVDIELLRVPTLAAAIHACNLVSEVPTAPSRSVVQ